jgi:UDP-glucose 4-epimerase
MADVREKTGCVVTGVAGFVGRHLAERLLSLGYEVVGVDNFSTGHRDNLDSFVHMPSFALYERSITEAGLLEHLKKLHPKLRYCFHLAAVVSVPYSVNHPEETMEVNYQATADLLMDANRLNFKAFIFAGSSAEYGEDQRLPLLEEYATEETRQLSPYGRAKFLASRDVASSFLGVALRCFNIYGPRQDSKSPYSGVISRFLDMAIKGEVMTVFGDGGQTRDFVFVSDVVEAYLKAAGLPGSCGPVKAGVYNVGTGKRTSILELARTVQKLTGGERDISFGPERPGDIRHSLASIRAFSHAAQWNPMVSLIDGLQQTLNWFRTTDRK